jgi:hypothetical protein
MSKPSKQDEFSRAQRDMIEQMRSESCLDRRIPLGVVPPFKVERGPSADAWYRTKHAEGRYGRFWLWHTSRAQ